MKKDLDHLFSSTGSSNEPRVPFVMDPSYTTGYVALLEQSLPLDRTVTFIANSQVAFIKKAGKAEEIRGWMAAPVARAASPQAGGKSPDIILWMLDGQSGTLDPAFNAHVCPLMYWALANYQAWQTFVEL